MGWIANAVAKVAEAQTRKRGRPAKPRKPKVESMPAISARQIRAARALLGIGQEEAAALAGIARPVYTRIENGTVRGRAETLDKIEAGFTRAGVEILYSGDAKGEGARMAKPGDTQA